MSTRTLSARMTRPMILVATLAAIALALSFAIRPAYATGNTATLKESQQGTDS